MASALIRTDPTRRWEPSARMGRLVRAEERAIRHYDQAITELPWTAVTEVLERLLASHRRAHAALQETTVARRTSAAALAATNDAVRFVLTLGGIPACLRTLRAAEDECLVAYAHLLSDGGLDPADRRLVMSELLPQQRSHEALLSWAEELAAVV